MIAPLEPPDCHHLAAAEGWLELGNPTEAIAELTQVTAEFAAHPAVLEINWQINAQVQQWEMCLELATRLVRLNPELPSGWIHRSYALHELQRTAEARDQLLPAIKRFPSEAVMSYNLACYECRLGDLVKARQWLKQTFALKDSARRRREALTDPDLAMLKSEIAAL